MDPIKNPFSPGAGFPPPELVGRDPVLEQARILLGRVKQKRSENSMLLTGLRGVRHCRPVGRESHRPRAGAGQADPKRNDLQSSAWGHGIHGSLVR